MSYLVAYDIADPGRLRRVARFMERRAVRCQKSVFVFTGGAEAVEALLDAVTPLLVLDQDVVQAWALAGGQPICGRSRGAVIVPFPDGVVLDGQDRLVVARRSGLSG